MLSFLLIIGGRTNIESLPKQPKLPELPVELPPTDLPPLDISPPDVLVLVVPEIELTPSDIERGKKRDAIISVVQSIFYSLPINEIGNIYTNSAM